MLIKNVEDLRNYYKFLENSCKVAFDIETTGLEPRKDKVIGFGVSNESEGFYIVHLAWDKEAQELKEVVPFDECVKAVKVLENKDWVGWNSSFEVRFVRHYFGVELSNSLHSEGMLSVHTVDENRMSYKLKEMGSELFGKEATEEQSKMKESIKANGGDPGKDYYMADPDLLGLYCVQDCLLTYKMDKIYLEKVIEEGLGDFYFKDEVMPLYKNVTINMEDRGIKLDLGLIERSRQEITLDIIKLEDHIQKQIEPYLGPFNQWYLNKELPPKRTGEFAQILCEFAGLELPKTKTGKYSLSSKSLEELPDSKYKKFLCGELESLPEETVREVQGLWWAKEHRGYMFNISSKDHLKRLFFEILDEEPVSKTAKGNPQADHLFLMEAAKKYDWVKDLIDYNKLNKIRSTYMDRFLEKQVDGIFYPSFFQHRTISGRYGSDLQQLPRPKEEGELSPLVLRYNNLVRKFFVARDGYKFIDSDYESLEPHVFAHVSGDEALKDIFRNGHDFYSTIAIGTEGLEGVSADKKADNYLGKVNKPLRQKAKAYSLGVPYGLGDYALGKQLDIPKEKADMLINNYLKAFPELKKWMDDSFDRLVKHGLIKSEAGRVRHFPSAPKIWYAHKDYILNGLDLWKEFHHIPKKYAQMKYLAKQFKNMSNNAKNFQIQSLAASITNRACIAINRELARKGIDGAVVAQIHDQIVIEVPEKDAETCRKMVQFLMENVYKLSLKLKAPAEISSDFYEGH